ncbi:hypothetical protein ACFRMQ_16845 [Kitasatospora sp. NPDC056783]|uniref:hypothetical protein n=1 Tax=Kitasatospora sp. NPDC056783 TaxID=3345943 RepID=UPI00368F43FD
MTEISTSQLHQEELEVELWEAPSPRPDAESMSELQQVYSDSSDQAVGNKAVGDGSALPDLGPLSDFKTWESVACTILHKLETASGFNPGSTVFDPVAWSEYLRKFSTIPFFLTYTSDIRHASISSLSLEKGIDAVSDLVENIMTPTGFQDVVTTIKKIARLAFESEGKTEKTSNLQLGILSRHERGLYLAVVRTAVEMKYKDGKGYEPVQQAIDIYRGYGVLDLDKCKRQAGTLLKWPLWDVNQWENETASAPVPPSESPAWSQ